METQNTHMFKNTLWVTPDLRGTTWGRKKQGKGEGRRGGEGGEEGRGGSDEGKSGGEGGGHFFFFFCHKGGGEEMMWEKQTGSLAGLPNVWKGPHWVNKALTGEELTTTRHHTHTHAHTHRGVERTRVSLIIWVRSFNPGWVEWRGLCACVC